MSKALAIKYQVGLSDQFQANRCNFLTFRDGVPVMVPEQVEARLHGSQHLVDGCLACVYSAGRARSATLFEGKRPRRLVREKHVDAAEALARLDLLVHEMPPLVVLFSRGGAAARSAAFFLSRRSA
jgi:hypothetical protein